MRRQSEQACPIDDERGRHLTRHHAGQQRRRAEAGRRISLHDAERLYEEADLTDLGAAAHAIRTRMNPGNRVSYIVAMNLNYTNVCTAVCDFCAFYRKVGATDAYVLDRDVLLEKVRELILNVE